jgi:hypothetical protein
VNPEEPAALAERGDGVSGRTLITKDASAVSTRLLGDIRHLIEEARASVAVAVNAGLTLPYWRIGERIRREILKGARAEYGAEIVATVSRQLEAEYGRGFAEKNVRRMM